MEKKGFTLVELLAVIAILAILILVVIPNIISLFNSSKKESFTTEIKIIAKIAEQQWIEDSIINTREIVYSKCNNGCTNPLKLSQRDQIKYYIKVNKSGKIIECYVTDDTYQYIFNGPGELEIEKISDIEQISSLPEEKILTITRDGGKTSSNSSCSGSNKPTNVLSFVNRANEKTITEGDEIKLGGENFYVIRSDILKTYLISKYDLKSDGGGYSQDTSGTNANIIKIKFANETYWDGCKYKNVNGTWKCSSSPSGLLSQYKKLGYNYCSRPCTWGSMCAQVYDSNSLLYPIISSYTSKIASASGTVLEGQIMKMEEANDLKIDIRKDKNNSKYWIGTPFVKNGAYGLWSVNESGTLLGTYLSNSLAVRPVIVIDTSTIISSNNNTYNITLNANGGDSILTSLTVVEGEAIGNILVPSKAGYIFDGWYTDLNGGEIIDESFVPNCNMEIFARWSEDMGGGFMY